MSLGTAGAPVCWSCCPPTETGPDPASCAPHPPSSHQPPLSRAAWRNQGLALILVALWVCTAFAISLSLLPCPVLHPLTRAISEARHWSGTPQDNPVGIFSCHRLCRASGFTFYLNRRGRRAVTDSRWGGAGMSQVHPQQLFHC